MYYQQHIFFCVNEREGKNRSCGGSGSKDLFLYAKRKCRAMLMQDPQIVRINGAGCLGRCESGPCVLVYPQGTWHQITSSNDVDLLLCETLEAYGYRSQSAASARMA